MPTTSYQEQLRRQRISEEWRPQGFERYEETAKCLDAMSTLDTTRGVGVNPDRYRGVSSHA